MKNYYKQIIIIVVLLVLIGGGIFCILKLNNSNNSNNNNNIKNTDKVVSLVDITKNDNKITQEFEVNLNGVKSNMIIEYTYNPDTFDIIGTYNDYKVAVLDYSTEENSFTEENIKTLINEDSFSTIKGTDNKEYLLFLAKGFLFPDNKKTLDFANMFILNDKLEVISKDLGNGSFEIVKLNNIPCKFESDKIEYENSFNIELLNLDDYEIRFKIEDNKIFYLSLASFNDAWILVEKTITINNNKLEEVTGNSYNVLELCKQN